MGRACGGGDGEDSEGFEDSESDDDKSKYAEVISFN